MSNALGMLSKLKQRKINSQKERKTIMKFNSIPSREQISLFQAEAVLLTGSSGTCPKMAPHIAFVDMGSLFQRWRISVSRCKCVLGNLTVLNEF